MNEEVYNCQTSFDLKPHGIIGIILIIFGEASLILKNWFIIAGYISIWTTPICWWGYIMLIDSIIYCFKKDSMIVNHKSRFINMLMLSNLFWVIFEVYNFYLKNWKYTGLPRNLFISGFTLLIAYATILPGLFFTAELLEIFGIFDNVKIPRIKIGNKAVYISITAGLCFLIFPLLIKQYYARYLFAFVWMGFLFLLEPINYASGADSFLRDLENGQLQRILIYLTAGYICGFLWEFWNFWAGAKWIYTIPFTSNLRIFEMPIAGFLGFGPFALEYFSMYNFMRLLRIKKPIPS